MLLYFLGDKDLNLFEKKTFLVMETIFSGFCGKWNQPYLQRFPGVIQPNLYLNFEC